MRECLCTNDSMRKWKLQNDVWFLFLLRLFSWSMHLTVLLFLFKSLFFSFYTQIRTILMSKWNWWIGRLFVLSKARIETSTGNTCMKIISIIRSSHEQLCVNVNQQDCQRNKHFRRREDHTDYHHTLTPGSTFYGINSERDVSRCRSK